MLSPVDDVMVTTREYLLTQSTMRIKKKPGNDLKPVLIILLSLQRNARASIFAGCSGSTLRYKLPGRRVKENQG